MIIDRQGDRPAGQSGQQAGETKQPVESPFESRHLPGHVGAEEVPERLVVSPGVPSADGAG